MNAERKANIERQDGRDEEGHRRQEDERGPTAPEGARQDSLETKPHGQPEETQEDEMSEWASMQYEIVESESRWARIVREFQTALHNERTAVMTRIADEAYDDNEELYIERCMTGETRWQR